MESAAATKTVLTEAEIAQKIKRLAFQILENNADAPVVYLAGIQEKGAKMARLLAAELQSLAPFEVRCLTVSLDKDARKQTEVTLSIDPQLLQSQVVVLVDDVLNTGRTLSFALQPFLEQELRRLETVVLIDRGYPAFPVMATYVGYRLATTLQEHVEVVFENNQPVAVLLR